jgi:hypothetical protein
MSIWDDLDNEAYMQKNKNLKRTSIIMNVILWVLGILLIAFGGYSVDGLKGVSELYSISLPAGVIVLGVFFVALTILGCYASYKERVGGLAIYTILMLILLICLIGIGGGTFKYRSEVMEKFGDAWEDASEGTRNVTQKYFNCCGWNSTSDFPAPNCLKYDNGTWVPEPHKEPCKDKIVNFARKYLYVAACAALVIGLIEFVAVLVSVFLVVRYCRNPRSDRLLRDHPNGL